MSIQSEIDRLAAAKAGLAAAISAKGVAVPDGATLSEYPALVEQIQGGGGGGASAPPKEVNFIDYDGTVLYAYTVSEAAALTELPPLPSHAGLICQGWNWSLDDIKALGRSVVVGAMYITDDGKTRLYITIPPNSMAGRPPARSDVPLYISQTVAKGVTIDWGDGSTTDTLDGTGSVNTTHHYDEAGDYVITLEPADGCELGLGTGSIAYCVMGSTGNNGLVYCNMLQKGEIGRGVTSIGRNAFSYCYSLSSITIPDGVTSIGDYTFQTCHSLSSITIPDSVTSIRSTAFLNCHSLSSITIPDGVTSIRSYAFSTCYGVKEYHLLPTTPPTLSSTTAFADIPNDCIIYVPAGSLEAYQTATNWSAYADQMQEEPS